MSTQPWRRAIGSRCARQKCLCVVRLTRVSTGSAEQEAAVVRAQTERPPSVWGHSSWLPRSLLSVDLASRLGYGCSLLILLLNLSLNLCINSGNYKSRPRLKPVPVTDFRIASMTGANGQSLGTLQPFSFSRLLLACLLSLGFTIL
jgi:hypothetical protein